ncbi:uncharacterized protein LOC128230286 isoform X3 [Mya arenaria]|uniref:uncharacterized protein LOC128230286 isoform X3 n=1 Tax=Mya arenaria TaxID=6604 RepID=UPI0022DFAE70|nr:uncharacterized protein LOC128230286 isoform X3 [Mya arenaria]
MFHLKYPRFRGFFSWDELGCLARTLGFPISLFRDNVTDEIQVEENGLTVQELQKMLEYKLLYKALHHTLNSHTADWNTCVIRRAAAVLQHKALRYEELYNVRLGYQTYEAGDMKGMVIHQHTLIRALKMCNLTISPLKLMHRIKHSRDSFDEPGRIQLYEFIDLVLWAEMYKSYVPEGTYGHFEMENQLFKLTDFDKLLSHHDERMAKRLDAQYLHEEWEFPETKVSRNRKFNDTTVVCGDSRVETDTCLSDYYLHRKNSVACYQKKSYRDLRSEVVRSEKTVHCVKGGYVRERPVTAPNLGRYNTRTLEEMKRRESARAQTALSMRLDSLLQRVYTKDKEHCFMVPDGDIKPVDLTDRPQITGIQRTETPQVVTETELDETQRYLERLLFDIETEAGRHEINRDTEMEGYIPKYKVKKDLENIRKASAWRENPPPSRPHKKYRDPNFAVDSLAYPVPRLPPSHARKCDARFRGWYDVRSKRGSHYILISQFLANTPKGELFRKMMNLSDAQIKKLHSHFLYRQTKAGETDKRPVTAPAVMSIQENQSIMRKGDHSDHVTIGEVTEILVPTEEDEEEVEEGDQEYMDNDRGDMSRISGSTGSAGRSRSSSKYSRSPDSGVENMNYSYDTSNTSISDKIKNLSLDQRNKVVTSVNKPRPYSAHDDRQEETLKNENIAENGGEEHPRSKSAPGDRGQIEEVEDIAPTPYMEHSKPRTVHVGSMGKITLLESISEAKFWENHIHGNKPKVPNVKEEQDSVKDSGTESAIDEVEAETHVAVEQIPDTDVIHAVEWENRDNSSPNTQKNPKRKETLGNVDAEFISMLLEEEKRRRRKRMPKRPSVFVSAVKPWQQKPSLPGNRPRPSMAYTNITSKAMTNTGPSTEQNTTSQCEQTSISLVNISKSKQLHLKKQKQSQSLNKYDGLVKRLGDNMTPYMKTLMLES